MLLRVLLPAPDKKVGGGKEFSRARNGNWIRDKRRETRRREEGGERK